MHSDVCGWTYVCRPTNTVVHALFMDAVKIVVLFLLLPAIIQEYDSTVRKVRMVDRSFIFRWNVNV